MPLLSIVIPVYNKEKYIAETLESVINQTFKDSEIIIINDGSKDNSLTICEEYAKKCDRIRIISQENAGVSAARNLGISESQGKYLVIVDADDTIESNMHEILISTAEKYDCDLVCSGYNFVTNTTKANSYNYPKRQLLNREYIIDEVIANSIGIKNNASSLGEHWCILYRLNNIKTNNICYDINQKKEEDKPFILKNLYYANSMVFVDECLYNYISRPGSLVSKYSPRFENCLKNLNLYYDLFKDYYDFDASTKINYNLGILEECIQFVYLHKKTVGNVKEEIINMLRKQEVLHWFDVYNGSDEFRLKIKAQLINGKYESAFKTYNKKFFKYRIKIFVRDLIKRG